MAKQSLREKFAAWYGKPLEEIRCLSGASRTVDGVWFYGDGGTQRVWCTKGAESWIEMPADVVEGIRAGRYGKKTGGAT